MANWFLDHLATGTGSGESPANAFTNLNSAWTNQNTWFEYGDILWVRRTHVSTVASTNAGRIGKFWDASSARTYSGFIGWPKSGEPFYDIRPVEAISAGWDNDTNSAYPSINMPAIVSSFNNLTNGIELNEGIINANMLWHNRAGNKALVASSNQYMLKTNLHYIGYLFNGANAYFHDVTITASTATHFFGSNAGATFDAARVTLTASCFCGLSLFTENTACAIGELVIQSNSIQSLVLQGSWINDTRRATIGTIRGTRPKTEIASRAYGFTTWNGNPIVVNDYYGEGPRTITANGARNYLTPSSATIRVNSQQALNCLVVNSGADQQFNIQKSRGIYRAGPVADARLFTSYENGVPLVVRVPIFVAGSMFVNPINHLLPHIAHLWGAGGGPSYVHSLTSNSGFTWDGSSTGTGSAWVLQFSWLPTESGSSFIDIFLHINRSRGGFCAIGQPVVGSA